MLYTFTINGVDRKVKRGSLRLVRLMNFRKTLEAVIVSEDGSYIPPEGGTAELKEAGVTIFLGSIQHTSVAGMAGEPLTPIDTRIDCVDSNGLADARYLNTTIPAGTVKSQVQFIIDTWLGAYGVTLDPSQDDGPSIPALAYTYRSNRRVSEGLTDIAQFALGRIWKINDSLELSMLDPADLPAPFDLAEGDDHVIGDFVTDVTSEGYANRIVIAGDASEVIGQRDTFVGDGVSTVFTLSLKNVPPPAPADSVPVAGGVWYDDGAGNLVFETAGLSGATWIWDPDANHFTDTGAGTSGYRTSPIPIGQSAFVIYNGMPEALATADDLVEQAGPKGVRELVITSDLTDPVALQALADSELIKHVALPSHGAYETEDVGLDSGQVQGIDLPGRGAVGSFLISEIETHDDQEAVEVDDDTPRLRHRVTVVEVFGSPSAGQAPGLVSDLYKVWSDSNSTGGTPPVVTPAGGGVPSPPHRSAQFDGGGVFDSSADVLIDKDGSGDDYGVDAAKARLAVGADLVDGETLIFHEAFAAGQSNTSFKTDGSVYNIYPSQNNAQDTNYPTLRYSENVKVVAGVGPSGENVCQPWQVSGSPAASVSSLVFDGFGPLADTRFDGSNFVAWVDVYLDSAQMTASAANNPILQLHGITVGTFPAVGTGAGQYPSYGSGDIYLQIYQASGDTWTAELGYRRAKTSGSDFLALTSFTFSKAAVQDAWHRFKIVYQAATIVDWSLIGNSNNTGAVASDGVLQAYMGATLMYDLSALQNYINGNGTSGQANRVQAFATGFDGMAGWVTNLHIGIPTGQPIAQLALWNGTAGKPNAFTGTVDDTGMATFKSPQDIEFITPKTFRLTADAIAVNGVRSAPVFIGDPVTLTNAQILTLPTLPVTIIPAPPSGFQSRLLGCTMVARITTAYTGLDTSDSDIHLEYPGGGYAALGPANNDTLTIPLDRLTTFIGTSLSELVANLIPYIEAVQFSATTGDWGYVQPGLTGVADVDAQVIQVAIRNGGVDLGGGHADNVITITPYFTLEALS